MQNPIRSGSRHFALHQLADGMFTAIAENGGAAISNSGIMDLGGKIIVYDSFLTPQSAMDLRQITENMFGQTPEIVVNSHYHNDHIWGNQAFTPETQIISSTRTRELIETAGKEEVQWYLANSAQKLEEFRSQYQNTHDEQERGQLTLWIGYYEGLVEAMPYLSVRVPSITFNDRLNIYGSKHSAELINFEFAHTESDTVLYLPKAGIVLMSDLLFVDCHPYLADGNPLKLLNALNVLKQLDATYFVPGHGPVGTIDDLKLFIEYIEFCMETAQILVNEGNTNDDRIMKLKLPEKYVHWTMSSFFYTNIRFLCHRLNSASRD